MAYPTVSGPYGFKPVNLIGGQVFSGSTRQLPIQYGYATNIFYGDFVAILRGQITRLAVTTAGGGAGLVGVFLGCSFTDPVTKQKRFSQYWPASTLAGDAMAVVADDPDTVFKAAVVSAQGGTGIGSVCPALVGQNLTASDLAGSANTGDSSNGIFWTTTTTTITYPLRLVDVVRDTAVSSTYTGSSATTTITLASGSFTSIIPIGTQVSYIAANGQLIDTSSYLAAATTVGGTTVALNSAVAVPGGVTAIPASSTIVFTQYPEGLVKLNAPGFHEYYTATAV
jgi:hypothetical protein